MAAFVALYATLSTVLPIVALWHGFRIGWHAQWHTGRVPTGVTVTRHRAPVNRLYTDEEWSLMRVSAGGW